MRSLFVNHLFNELSVYSCCMSTGEFCAEFSLSSPVDTIPLAGSKTTSTCEP